MVIEYVLFGYILHCNLRHSSAKSSFPHYTEVQRKQCLGNDDTDFSRIKFWQGRLLSCLVQQKINKSWLLFVPQAGQSCCGLSQSLNTSPSRLVTGSHTSRMPTMTQLTLRWVNEDASSPQIITYGTSGLGKHHYSFSSHRCKKHPGLAC